MPMPLKLEAGIMKVGNSKVLLLPKPLDDSFEITTGTKVTIIVGDEGLFVPLKSKVMVSDTEKLKELQKYT